MENPLVLIQQELRRIEESKQDLVTVQAHIQGDDFAQYPEETQRYYLEQEAHLVAYLAEVVEPATPDA